MQHRHCSTPRRHIPALFGLMILVAGAGAVHAAQPTFVTLPGTPLLSNILYVVPYAVSDHVGQRQPDGSGTPAETIISIGLPLNVTTSCRVQVEWVNWDGTTAGVSGPFSISGQRTFEFTTVHKPAVLIPPYNLNVFSNIEERPFEGHARIRTGCASGTKLRVEAKFATDFLPAATGAPGNTKLNSLLVLQPTGNVGQ